jgi:hypothetical protein
MLEFCRGGAADGLVCDCEEYSPLDDPEEPLSCAECNHGQSKHPKKNDQPSGKTSILKLFQGVMGKKGITSLEQA